MKSLNTYKGVPITYCKPGESGINNSKTNKQRIYEKKVLWWNQNQATKKYFSQIKKNINKNAHTVQKKYQSSPKHLSHYNYKKNGNLKGKGFCPICKKLNNPNTLIQCQHSKIEKIMAWNNIDRVINKKYPFKKRKYHFKLTFRQDRELDPDDS